MSEIMGVNTSNDYWNHNADTLYLSRVVAPVTGTLISLNITIHAASPTGGLKMGLFESDGDNYPTNRLVAPAAKNLANGTVTFDDLDVSVTQDKVYWVASMMENTTHTKALNGNENRYYQLSSGQSYSSGIPSTAPTGQNLVGTWEWTAWGVVEEGGGAVSAYNIVYNII